jgi:hypothetical protein
MPFWSRYPKGTYVRPSTEWYAHQRGRCSIGLGGADGSGTPVYGLFNNSAPGVYLHVIGLVLYDSGEAGGLHYGKFYTGMPNQSGVTVPAPVSPTSAFYSNDPMPPGIGVFGNDLAATFDDAFLVIEFNEPLYFYPTREIAVIAPGDTFGIYVPNGLGFFNIMWEWYWAID